MKMLPCWGRLHLLLRCSRPNFLPTITSPSHSSHLLLLFPRSLAFSSTIPDFSDPNEPSSRISAPTQESIIYVLKKLDKMPQKALKFFNFAISHYGFTPDSSVCNMILRILAHKEHTTDFWALLNSMKDNGFQLDEGTYAALLDCFKKQKLITERSALAQFFTSAKEKSSTDETVKSAAKIILDAQEWSKEVEKVVNDLKLPLSEGMVALILKELRDCPLKALGFYTWASGDPNYKHGSVASNAMARVLGREESIEEFWSLVKGMENDMDIDTYVKILRQFLRRKMMKDAVELYEFMMDGPYKPAIQDCGMLLRMISLSSNPDLDLVFRVVKKYEAAGYSLSKVVYDGIHRSLSSTGRFDEAVEIMKKMRQEGYEPDNITYSQLVYGLCKSMRFDDACKVLVEMEEGGCSPDLMTWTVLIQGYCSAGEVDRALECLAKMIEKNIEVDADLLDVIVKGLCGIKRIQSAYTCIVEMVDTARVRPWKATYENLIQVLLDVGKLEEALKLLNMMKKYSYPFFKDPFVAHISKFGTTEDAVEFLKIITGKTCPSSTTYINLFKAFFEQGRHTEAQDLLFKCPHHIRNLADIRKLFGSMKDRKVT